MREREKKVLIESSVARFSKLRQKLPGNEKAASVLEVVEGPHHIKMALVGPDIFIKVLCSVCKECLPNLLGEAVEVSRSELTLSKFGLDALGEFVPEGQSD